MPVIGLFVLCVGSSALGSGVADRSAIIRFTPSTDEESRVQSLMLIDSYYSVVRDARKALKNERMGLEGRVYAIHLLGQMRAEDAVPELLDLIELDAEPIMRYTAIQWHGRFPAQIALSKIGLPSVREIGKRLPSENSPAKRKLFFAVVRSVLGVEPGLSYLDSTLSQNATLSVESRKMILDVYRAEAGL